MTDKEEQDDELLALSHIFDESVFTSTPAEEGEDAGGQFLWNPQLPDDFHIQLNQSQGAEQVELHKVCYLPPVVLNFQLPPEYPSTRPPDFTLSSKWLTMQQLTSLCQKLDSVWEENKGMVILFMWMNFLQDEAFTYLDLQSPLDLSSVLSRKRRLSGRGSVPRGSTGGSDEGNLTTSGKPSDSVQTWDSRAIQDIASQDRLLPTILDYDKHEKRRQFEKECFSCEVCFLEKLGAHCIMFVGCGHVYCKDCMRDYFTVQIKDGNVNGLMCPADRCESQAHPAQVQGLVDSELFTKYDELLLQTSLQTMMDIVYCPRPSCQCPVIIDRESNLGNCPGCCYVFCTLCKLTYHGLSPCKVRSDELRKLREEYLSGTEEEKIYLEKRYGKQTLRNAVEEAYSNEWLDQFSKQCPQCSAHIQKIDGCNKMTCMKCRAYFCWICNHILSRNNPYSHFNQPGQGCFNRLFEGVQTNGLDDDDDWMWEALQ